jgi:uncharacterized protein (DUF2237 family)
MRPALLAMLLSLPRCAPRVPDATRAPSPADGTAAACVGPGPQPDAPGARNVLNTALRPCPSPHRTGYRRDGACHTGPDDHGVHVVCARVTEAFLRFTAAQGNDLSTPRGGFPGLREGDGWCLCAARWEEARLGGAAPPVVREATERRALDFTSRAALDAHALGGTSPPR